MRFSDLKQLIYDDFVHYWRVDGYTKSEPVSHFSEVFNQDIRRVTKAIKQMIGEDVLVVAEDTHQGEVRYKLSPVAYMLTVAALEAAGLAPPPFDGESWIKHGVA